MRQPIDSKLTEISVRGLLLFTFTIIIYSTIARIKDIKIPHISDRDLVFWLVEFNEY